MRQLRLSPDKMRVCKDLSPFANTHTHTSRQKHTFAHTCTCVRRSTNQLKGANVRLQVPTRCPSRLQAQKGLKSHQPLRTFLLLLNWPEPLHIKLQGEKSWGEVEIDTNPLPPPATPALILALAAPFRSTSCWLFTARCRSEP